MVKIYVADKPPFYHNRTFSTPTNNQGNDLSKAVRNKIIPVFSSLSSPTATVGRERGEPARKRSVYLRDTVFSLHFNEQLQYGFEYERNAEFPSGFPSLTYSVSKMAQLENSPARDRNTSLARVGLVFKFVARISKRHLGMKFAMDQLLDRDKRGWLLINLDTTILSNSTSAAENFA